MSTKSSILLSSDDEHWYYDIIRPSIENPDKNVIILEFNKKNIEVDENNEKSLVISITNSNCDIYKVISTLLNNTKI